jgi:eukaryotic-like serine/threonine-protein kinase
VIKNLRPGDPATVGPYQLLGRLGVGGMGQVYLAKSPGGRLVAIKLIRPELADEHGFRARFASEITAAKNVSGIYTAAVVDADAEAEFPWMATVYVPGPSLSAAVEAHGPLPVKSVLALAAGLAEALQAIHRAGLVHRDLKPSNVLLATDGPRVIDFGISLALERSTATTTGMVLGSPGFMSPEQASGQREVGAPTDVFTLGAVLAFAATGSSPFGVGPTPALLYRVVNELPDLTAVPDRVRPLIWHCLAKEPAERPTPAEVLALLGDDVGVLTGEWLPPAIAETMNSYGSKPQSPAPPESPVSGPRGTAPTVLEPASAPSGESPVTSVDPSVTRTEYRPLADTLFEPVSNPFTADDGWDASGGTGGTPSHRWQWPVMAAAGVVVSAAVSGILLIPHSSGTALKSGSAPKGVTSTASLAGNAAVTPTPTATAGRAKAPARPLTSQLTTQPTFPAAGRGPVRSASPPAARPSPAPRRPTSSPSPAAPRTSAPLQDPTSPPAVTPTTPPPAPAPAQTPTLAPTATQAPTSAPAGTPTPDPSTQPPSGSPTSSDPAASTDGTARFLSARSRPRGRHRRCR